VIDGLFPKRLHSFSYSVGNLILTERCSVHCTESVRKNKRNKYFKFSPEGLNPGLPRTSELGGWMLSILMGIKRVSSGKVC